MSWCTNSQQKDHANLLVRRQKESRDKELKQNDQFYVLMSYVQLVGLAVCRRWFYISYKGFLKGGMANTVLRYRHFGIGNFADAAWIVFGCGSLLGHRCCMPCGGLCTGRRTNTGIPHYGIGVIQKSTDTAFFCRRYTYTDTILRYTGYGVGIHRWLWINVGTDVVNVLMQTVAYRFKHKIW